MAIRGSIESFEGALEPEAFRTETRGAKENKRLGSLNDRNIDAMAKMVERPLTKLGGVSADASPIHAVGSAKNDECSYKEVKLPMEQHPSQFALTTCKGP